MSIFTVCISVHHVFAVPTEVKKEHRIPWNWSYIRPGPLEEHPAYLTTETPL